MAEQGKDTLSILVDVRSRLDELVQSQREFVKLRQEVNSTGNMLRTGFGIDIARRGLDLLTNSTRQYVFEAFRMADQIDDQARNLEISNRAYQVFGNLLKDAGGDVAQLTQTVSTNNRSLVEARNVSSAAAAAYRQLGLDVAELERLPFELRMQRISRAIAGASDRTAAYSAASQILGTRNLPTLLGALRDLAEKGWDKVSESQERAGRVMSDDTVARLAAAKKEIEKLNQAVTIGYGETIGLASQMSDAFKKDRLGTAGAFVRMMFGDYGSMAAQIAKTLPQSAPQGPAGDGGAAARQIELAESRTRAEMALAKAMADRQVLESDPNRTEEEKKGKLIELMEKEYQLRSNLAALIRSMPTGGVGEMTAEQKQMLLLGLNSQNSQLSNSTSWLRGGTDIGSQNQSTRDNFDKMQAERVGAPSIGSQMGFGAMEWVTGLGTGAQQASDLLQSSLGATVSGIGGGIRGWLTGAKDFGSSMLELGESVFGMFLDTIIQMGVQWLVTQALIKTGMISTHAVGEGLRATRVAATAAEGAAATASLAPAAGTASVATMGAAAWIGLAALIAVMAAFSGFMTGGYTGDGPVDQIAGVVHGKEGVLNAGAMRRLGVENLNALNAGRSISVGNAPSVISAGGGYPALPPNFIFYMDQDAAIRAYQENSRAFFVDLMKEWNRKNS